MFLTGLIDYQISFLALLKTRAVFGYKYFRVFKKPTKEMQEFIEFYYTNDNFIFIHQFL